MLAALAGTTNFNLHGAGRASIERAASSDAPAMRPLSGRLQGTPELGHRHVVHRIDA